MFYYGSHLPHWHPPGHALFLTVRLDGSLPAAVLEELHRQTQDAERAAQAEPAAEVAYTLRRAAQRRFFALFEHHLEHGAAGADWLRQPGIQQLVLNGLHHQCQRGHYALLAACVMPNHLHAVLRLPPDSSHAFKQTWADFKRFSGRKANALLGRKGRFWEDESYDHVVRDGDEGLGKSIRYTAHNPVKAGLCAEWHQWPGTWVADEWREIV